MTTPGPSPRSIVRASRRRDEGVLRLRLLDQLLAGDESTEGLLLLVDESQALAVHLLEELRMLTNLARGGVPRVRLVLAGLPSLEEQLAGPDLEAFSQRLAARCYVAPLSRAETTQYVRAQLAASGADPQKLFSAAACDAVFNATDGVPRLVNQLCDRALLAANEQNLTQVDAAVVQAAWADIEQLPTPCHESTESAAASRCDSTAAVVEFGSLAADDVATTSHTAEPTAAGDAPRPTEPPAIAPDNGISPDVVAASSAEEPVEPTELDEDESELVATVIPQVQAPNVAPPQLIDSSTARRRSRSVYVSGPDAVDPFAGPFDEEEVVLDSFVALSGMFRTRTPRVDNFRDPNFARLVENALDVSAVAPSCVAQFGDAFQAEVECGEQDGRGPIDVETHRPSLRLAIVEDSPPMAPTRYARQRPKSLVLPDVDEVAVAATVDDDAREPANAPPVPAAATEASAVGADAAFVGDTSDAILVIDDEPAAAAPSPGVRREEYRQLFSRLRHGS